jgi:hypothetical protein
MSSAESTRCDQGALAMFWQPHTKKRYLWLRPLHSGRTSAPMICQSSPVNMNKQAADRQRTPKHVHAQNQSHNATHIDLIHFVLWSGHHDLIIRVCSLSVNNLQRTGANAEVLNRLLQRAKEGLDYARVVFFLLLNVDTAMKQATVEGIPTLHVNALHSSKAPGFFVTLHEDVIPTWQRNEFETVHTFLRAVKRAYLVS